VSAVTAGTTPASAAIRSRRLRDLLRSTAGPVIGALVLTGLLSAWVISGGAGTITRVRLQVSLAAVPMRAFTARAAAAVGAAPTFLSIRNLGGTADELIGVRSTVARYVILTERDGPAAPETVVAGLAIPPHGTLILSPFGDDAVLQDPSPFETLPRVPLTLTFRHAGTVTIQAEVTAPGTP
jgi:copper(I)-binding protein